MSIESAVRRGTVMTGRIDWTPYIAGIGIGVLSWLVFVIVAAPIGVTTAGSQVAGGVAGLVVGQEAVQANPYWARNPLHLDYGSLFLVGIFLGALASALIGKRFQIERVPPVWQERFGRSIGKRYAAAFIGGIITMYGARMAGGCTSGNGISQGLQLAVVGWAFLAAMFATGVITAHIAFRR
jgi:hypothetical protein